MSGRSIRLSARGILQLLAGVVSQEQFLQDHGFAPSAQRQSAGNPFAAAIKSGRLLTRAEIERSDDVDDDWLVLELDGPDAAVSAFNVVESNEEYGLR